MSAPDPSLTPQPRGFVKGSVFTASATAADGETGRAIDQREAINRAVAKLMRPSRLPVPPVQTHTTQARAEDARQGGCSSDPLWVRMILDVADQLWQAGNKRASRDLHEALRRAREAQS